MKPWVRRTACMALLIPIGAIGVGCGSGSSGGGGSGERTLTIGDVVPLTGELGVFGPSADKAAHLAVQEANKAAKQAGIPYHFAIATADEQSSPQDAVSAARKVVSQGATCITGVDASADAIAIGESLAKPQQIPVIAPATTSAALTTLDDGGYVFRTAPSNNLQGPVLARVVADKLGGAQGKTISLAGRNDAYGQGLVDTVKRAWEAMGGHVSGPVLYDPQQASYDSEAKRIVSGSPAAYVIVDFPETYAKVGAALLRTGSFDAHKLFIAEALANATVPPGIPPAALVGATGTRPSTPATSSVTKAYNALYASAPGTKDSRPFDAYNFDATLMCILASVAANSTTGSDIQAHIQSVSSAPGEQFTYLQLAQAFKALRQGKDINYEGASGPVDLDSAGDPTSVVYDVYTYGADKSLKVERQVMAK